MSLCLGIPESISNAGMRESFGIVYPLGKRERAGQTNDICPEAMGSGRA